MANASSTGFKKSSGYVANVATYTSVLVLLSLGCYNNVLHGEFAFDDQFAIVNNDLTHPDKSANEILSRDFWGAPISSTSSHKSFRPLTTLCFRLLRWLSRAMNLPKSDLDTFYFHVANTVMHCCVTLLVFKLGVTLFNFRYCGHCQQNTSVGHSFRPKLKAFIAAVLFAVH
eukprot:654648_1